MNVGDAIAEAVVTELNSQSWLISFTAEHVQVVDPLTNESTSPRVIVLDAEINVSRASRRVLEEEVLVDVALQERIDPGDNVRVQELKQTAQAILRHFALTADVGYSILSGEYLAHRVPEHLREDKVFTALVRLTYRNYHRA